MSVKPPPWDPALPHECHDCGEFYEAGVPPTACLEAAHYVAPAACELPDPTTTADSEA